MERLILEVTDRGWDRTLFAPVHHIFRRAVPLGPTSFVMMLKPTNSQTMKKFLAIYYAPWSAMQQMATMTDEQKQAGMKPWMDWMEKHASNLEDGGAPLMPPQSLTPDGKWADSTKEVTGYSIVKAENVEAAKKLFDGHPHLSWAPGCSVEVAEFARM